MTVNTVFQRFQNYFPILPKACFLYYFRAASERLAFNSSAIMCYVIKTENIKLYKYFTVLLNTSEITPLFIKWTAAQKYSNNDVLLIPLKESCIGVYYNLATNVVVKDHKKLNVHISRSTWFWEMVCTHFVAHRLKFQTAQKNNSPIHSNRAKLIKLEDFFTVFFSW